MLQIVKLYGGAALAVAVGLIATSSLAATITDSPSPPPQAVISQQDSSGIYQLTQDFTDNGGTPGQTFTATAATPTLTGFTFKGENYSGGNTQNFVFQVGLVNTITGGITQLANDSVNLPVNANGPDYLTYTPTTPIPLIQGDTYEVSAYTTSGYFGFAHSTGDVYAGGTAFNNDLNTTDAGNADPTRTFNGFVSPRSYDFTFFVNPTPEPASLGIAAIAAGCLLVGRRSRMR